jgi:hypothetical protein
LIHDYFWNSGSLPAIFDDCDHAWGILNVHPLTMLYPHEHIARKERAEAGSALAIIDLWHKAFVAAFLDIEPRELLSTDRRSYQSPKARMQAALPTWLTNPAMPLQCAALNFSPLQFLLALINHL